MKTTQPARGRSTAKMGLHGTSHELSYTLVLVLLLLMLLPARVQADGGAPNLAYVAGAGRGISVIDIVQREVRSTFPVAGDPQMILLSLDGGILYVTQPALGQVAEIAARTGRLLCTISVPGHPTLLALSVDGTLLYAAGGGTQVTALDPTTCAVQHTFQINEPVNGLAVTTVVSGNKIHNQLWVAGTTALTVVTENEQQIDHIPIPGGPRSLCLPGGLTVYVTTQRGSVVAIDMQTHQVFAQLLTGGHFGPMDYNALTGEVYVPDQQHSQLDVLAPLHAGTLLTPQEPDHVIPLNGSPQSVAITSDGQLGFVALRGGVVSMLDIPGRQSVKTFTVGGTPRFIITGLYPPPADPTPRQAPAVPPPSGIIALLMALLALLVGLVLYKVVDARRPPVSKG